ncbi:hypothetical protein UFOVP175_36 [uncultured Caudovirales phage]|uniref:ART-PolyVal-like domain-containing protein n=1 Tax=uncultured Caudovirales phage TaxID=2100421 RepID=A0A6J7WBL0_9CAUD|nr:hypothetical protein UFOVP175_36 [uncultured Caudovirales phage]
MTLSQADVDSLLGPQPADSVESLLDAPLTGEDISLAMQDPSYQPTQDDYLKFEEYSKSKQVDWIDTIAKSVDAAAGMIGGAVAEGAQGAVANPLNYIEGAAQGTRQLYGLVAQSQDPSSALFRFKDLVAGTGTPESRYQQFLDARDFANTTARLERGEEGLFVPPELTNPEFVQGVSMILDPTLALPGIGEVFGAGKLATRAVGKGTQLAGRAIAGAARPLERVAGAAERMTAEALGMAPEALRSTAATAGIAGALGIAPEAAAFAAIPAGIRTAREAGEALARAGENLMTQPSRIGPLEAIGAAPGANLRQRMLGVVGQYGGDAALDASLRSIAGGIEGGAIGAGLGYLSGGEEGAAAGLGSGGVQGAAGALGGRMYQKLTGAAAKEARAGDLGRFIDAQQDPTTKALFERVRDAHGVDTASALMDVGDLVKGQFGDIDIRYLSDTDFVDQYKGRARGVQVEIGDRPTIVINADILGKGKGDSPLYTLGHELFHALEKSQQLSGGATEIKNALVGRWIQEGDVIRKLADGVFNDAEIEARFNEYRDKLAAGNKQRADELAQFDTINKKADYIASELAAEHFAALIAGQKPDAMLKGFTGLSRQLLDAALTQNASKAIANAAASIERTFGVKPTDSVLFPDLKQASPQVNAMLRDLLRARKRLDEKIMLESEQGGRVLKPEDVANPLAGRELVDMGVAEQMPDGTIRNLSTDEIRARDDKDMSSLRSIAENIPGARVVDGAFMGRFSPEQLSAIDQSQSISSRMKDKIRGVNAAMDAGNSIHVVYSAALKRAYNRITKKYSPKYDSGIRVSEREVLPYAFYLSKADNPLVKVIDITKVRNALTKELTKDGSIGGLWNNTDGFMADLAKYFTNLDQKENARRSYEIFGDAKARFLGDFVNAQEKGGRKFVRDLRLDRIGSMSPMDFRARISEDAIQLSKQRWMPAETIGDKSVINSDEGYRIISGAKHKLYGPDGKLIGIYDTQTQAERKADATQARLQPEVRQQQYQTRDEVRKTAEAGRGDSAVGRTQGREEGRQELGAVRQAGDVRFMPMSDLERSDLDLRISTRNPSAKRATEDPLAQQLSIDLESIMKTPGALPEIINTVGKYPGIKFERSGSVNRANDFIRFVANNLIYLHDNVPSDIRQRSKLWYDGARKLTEDWSKRFDTTREGVAGVIASLSPQKDWYQNVTLAERVFEVVKNRQDEAFTGPIEQWARTKMTSGQSPKRLVQDEVINGMAGKKFSQLSDYEKAVFVRAFDEVNNTRTYPIVSPEGQMLDIARKADGTPATYAWGDFNSIAKAVKIAGSPNKKTVSESLGFEHKVRSFYDNILLPNNPEKGDVTIDTHAVAAALMLPLAGSDVPVAHNFGQGVPGSSVYGTSGTYGIYADAYRLAAQERGILPREMQSITWEAIRGLFTPEFKTAQNKKLVENLWKEYKTGKVTLDETRQRIVDTAGGIRNPSWYGSGGGAVAENAPTAQPQKLSVAGDMGRPGANAGGGGAISGGSAQEVAAQRYMPSDTDYLSAVKQGDTQAAQRMVDEAAKAAGYTVGPVFHGSAARFNQFKRNFLGTATGGQSANEAFFFSTSDRTAKNYASYASEEGPIKDLMRKADQAEAKGDWDLYDKLIGQAEEMDFGPNAQAMRNQRREQSKVYNVYLNGRFLEMDAEGKTPAELSSAKAFKQFDGSLTTALKSAKRKGYDGVVFRNLDDAPNLSDPSDHYAIFDPNKIKLSDPITKDDAGNVIPLSQRFKATSDDIRYMPSPDSSMPGAYSFPGGYRALPGKAKGSLRLYGPAGSLIGIASSLDEAQRILRRKAK